MTQNPSRKLFLSAALLWFCTTAVGMTQTPATDLDSITEDSYQRMLQREALEKKSDSVLASPIQARQNVEKSREHQRWYYAVAVLTIAGVMLWYYRRASKRGTH